MKDIRNAENGIALLLVLWVLTLLTVIVGEFCHAMRNEVNITRNFKEEIEAYYIAYAGLNTAITEIIRGKVTGGKRKSDEGQEGEAEEIRWRINAEIPPIPFANGKFKVEIENESGKVNLNRANVRLLKIMLNAFDLEDREKDVIVDSIIDWRDKNNLHRLNGAEDDYYLALPEPYECKDGDFDSIDELLLVRGVTKELFYGGLRDMVTVYPKRYDRYGRKKIKTKKNYNSNRINLNAASPQFLLSLPQMTEELVHQIVEYREEDDFRALSELIPVVGTDIYSAISPYLTLKTNSYFMIKSIGMVEGTRTRSGLQVLIQVDPLLKKKYRIIEWIDSCNAS